MRYTIAESSEVKLETQIFKEKFLRKMNLSLGVFQVLRGECLKDFQSSPRKMRLGWETIIEESYPQQIVPSKH